MPARSFDDVSSFSFPVTLLKQEDRPKVLDSIKKSNPILLPPGVNILGAWSPVAPPSLDTADKRSVQYNIDSGTSMATPHVTGAAPHVKAAHTTWSAAAIKSALLTTANVMDPRKNYQLEREFAYGSGLLNALKAVDPGLVYDASENDYVEFLCKQGYDNKTLRLITGDNSVCRTQRKGMALELPAVHARRGRRPRDRRQFRQNGPLVTAWHSRSRWSPRFCPSGEGRSFAVRVRGERIRQVPIISGSVSWDDGVHVVGAPLVIYTVVPGALNISIPPIAGPGPKSASETGRSMGRVL
ncbi:Peptidase S8, subtilisin-related [Parasponia andersonii]|uniref:Peptidase S8, subtilisin-related n=1 Tax=Parasponia andersonii TaxID=3476 RepID=A0A2P5D9H2_PARAD|nr:Peptidase S8, subtilisin-related [Parasponia andersonii]